MSLSMILVTCL